MSFVDNTFRCRLTGLSLEFPGKTQMKPPIYCHLLALPFGMPLVLEYIFIEENKLSVQVHGHEVIKQGGGTLSN